MKIKDDKFKEIMYKAIERDFYGNEDAFLNNLRMKVNVFFAFGFFGLIISLVMLIGGLMPIATPIISIIIIIISASCKYSYKRAYKFLKERA